MLEYYPEMRYPMGDGSRDVCTIPPTLTLHAEVTSMQATDSISQYPCTVQDSSEDRYRSPRKFGNKYDIRGDIVAIHVSSSDGRSFEALIDASEFEHIKSLGGRWRAQQAHDGSWGVIRSVGSDCQLTDRLHRAIAGRDGGNLEHVNGNAFDNRRCNLRTSEQRKRLIRAHTPKPVSPPGPHAILREMRKSNPLATLKPFGNDYEVNGEIVSIFLNRKDGERITTTIDLADFDYIRSLGGTWSAQWSPYTKSFYVFRAYGPAKNRKRLLLHNAIVGNPRSVVVDHINCNTLDNRRSNLRMTTRTGNGINRNPDGRVTNVYRIKGRDGYHAKIKLCGRQVYLGCFHNEADAVDAVNRTRAEAIERERIKAECIAGGCCVRFDSGESRTNRA